MSKSSKKAPNKIKKNIARAFLIVGLVLSILSFLGALGLLLLYFGLYFLAFLVLALITFVITVSVGASTFVVLFFVGFFAALFGATNLNFMGDTFNNTFQQTFPYQMWNTFGQVSLFYLIGLPITILLIVNSFIAMIFAIVALVRLNKSKSKAGGIVGGVFAIFSAVFGVCWLHEFVGGILMFIISSDEYALGHEEKHDEYAEIAYEPIKVITKEEVLDYTN